MELDDDNDPEQEAQSERAECNGLTEKAPYLRKIGGCNEGLAVCVTVGRVNHGSSSLMLVAAVWKSCEQAVVPA
ncbi:hypothetical protein AA14337_0735 [Acetobacter malorum DSM 14337]|uniref:Transposase n=1 Tax=Acetobacter malorum DSM 14337 TaxID=1307910 RepID=A0ABQ0PPT3_9PROT|nr:hypothetical protein AA14337_0735 [Acetobacter malorum DSM 14337]